jgi:succinate dehydrogenase (ubiquinone) cytochrome b560 subunit
MIYFWVDTPSRWRIMLKKTLYSTSGEKDSQGTATSDNVLVKQRRNRPVSPHLSIYRPQVTWILSITNRLTGLVLSGGFYLFGAAYLVAPYLGWGLSVGALESTVAAWPAALVLSAKALIAWPFTFHALNGVRHLVWDAGRMLTKAQVNRTGWLVVGLSTAAAVGLACW